MSVGLLVVVAIIFSLKVKCNACCDDYECNLIVDSTNCGYYDSRCIWLNGACKTAVCEDYTTQTACSGSKCKWSGSACTTVNSCAEWDSVQCNFRREYSGDDSKACVYKDSACKVAVCGDYTDYSSCNNTNYVGGQYTGCYWDSGTSSCKNANGCSSWDSSVCSQKYWNDQHCGANEAGTCVVDACSIYGSTTCNNNYRCKWSGTACSDVTSCGDYDTSSRCDQRWVSNNNVACKWTGTACHVAECSDWNGDSYGCDGSGTSSGSSPSYYYQLNCAYTSSSSTCSVGPALPGCGTFSTTGDCENNGCYWLSSCPVEDVASVIFVPALLVALLLAFLL